MRGGAVAKLCNVIDAYLFNGEASVDIFKNMSVNVGISVEAFVGCTLLRRRKILLAYI